MWNATDWQKVVFSDEWFVLSTDDNLVRVWRRPSERYCSPHTFVCHIARTVGVSVLGAIVCNSRSTLVVVRWILMGQCYVDDILLPHVGPFLNGLPGALLQQDNAPPHTARIAQDFLRHVQTPPLVRLVPYRACVGSSETPDAAVSFCTWIEWSRSRFVGPSASGQHKTSHQLHAGPCCSMYCSRRRSNALLILHCIWVSAHPVFV